MKIYNLRKIDCSLQAVILQIEWFDLKSFINHQKEPKKTCKNMYSSNFYQDWKWVKFIETCVTQIFLCGVVSLLKICGYNEKVGKKFIFFRLEPSGTVNTEHIYKPFKTNSVQGLNFVVRKLLSLNFCLGILFVKIY